MTWANGDSLGSQNFTFTVVGGAYIPQAIPACAQCKTQTLDNIENEGKPICKRCAFILGAPRWLEAMFVAVGRDRAKVLYRALATVFHPDSGGDERLMKALNAAKERFS
ncbi:MAG TPA: hypothetical protein VHR97_01630 [Candidatus Baltobacteraceae bacterium]|nr:hypothetical protein [Candidatus Baltobacteraceae bacterium]